MANRVVIGAFDGTYVLRVSKPGYNALDPDLPSAGLVFDSRWATFAAVHQQGTISLPVTPDTPASTYVYHGTGFVPFVIWFLVNYPGNDYTPAPGSGVDTIRVTADANYLYFYDLVGMGGTVRYMLTRTRLHG